jgi:hypothetical protein
MPELSKIGWWKYETSAFRKAWQDTSNASIGRGLAIAVLALIGQLGVGLRGEHDTWLMVLIAVGAGVVVFLIEFLIKLFRVPPMMARETYAIHVGTKCTRRCRRHEFNSGFIHASKNGKPQPVGAVLSNR